MKEKLSFVLSDGYSEYDNLIRCMGCVEEAEHVFGIEFAAGVEYEGDVKKILFASDYLFTDKEDEFLEKYDGMVVETYFRDKNTNKVYDLTEYGCRLDITYDDESRHNGNEEFSNPKIVTKGYAYPKSNKKMKIS